MPTPDTPMHNMAKEKNHPDSHQITNFNDSLTDATLSSEECSVGNESTSPFHSVYCPTTVEVKYKKRKGLKKYATALKHLRPVRVSTGPKAVMPVDQAGCWAFTCFSWLSPLISRSYRKGLSKSDMYYCSPYDGSRVNGARLSIMWDHEVTKHSSHSPSLLRLLRKFVLTRIVLSCLLYFFCLAFGFVGPMVFMKELLDYVRSSDNDAWIAAAWVIGLTGFEVLRVGCFLLMWAVNLRTATRATSGVMSFLYRKLIKTQILTVKSVGEFVDSFSNDVQKLYRMVLSIPLLIGGPLQIIGTIVYTGWLIGPVCAFTLGVFMLAYILQFLVAKKSAQYREKVMEITDQRISLMTEFLTHIKFIKLNAWEKPMTGNITGVRTKEWGLLEKCQYLQLLNSSIASMVPYVLTICTILIYITLGNDLTSSEAFTLVTVNVLAAHGIITLPTCIQDTVNGVVAVKRLQKILDLEERDGYTTLPSNPEHAVYISKAKLAWGQSTGQLEPNSEVECNDTGKISQKEEISSDTALVTPVKSPPVLLDLSLIIPKGKLVGICGPVGSGKSSLLSALLGQMKLHSGQVAVRGQCAYVPQQSWILRTSLLHNIVFGNKLVDRKFYDAVRCCGLLQDIAQLRYGEKTEIGDRGVTLSGGQKQRICLARAVYSDNEVYLLDDPLSAVDGHSGQYVFQHCIKGALREKTVLFVTHQVQYLKECDFVVYMRDGKIIEQGTHEDLMSKENEYFALIQALSKDDKVSAGDDGNSVGKKELKTPKVDEQRSPSLSPSPRNLNHTLSNANSVSDVAESAVNDGQLVGDERTKKGSVSWDTYKCYIKAAGGFIVCFFVIACYLIHASVGAFSNFWLSYWLKQGSGNQSEDEPITADEVKGISHNPELGFYQMIYGLSAGVIVVFGLILGHILIKTSLKASSNLHDLLLNRISCSPMYFFETEPIGRVLNIFTRDQDEIDIQLPKLIDAFLLSITVILCNLGLTIYVFHWFAIPLAVIAIAFIYCQQKYRTAMRDLKRFENISRSPIYDHVSTTIEGISTIHAFKKQERFIEKFIQLVDANMSPLYLFHSSVRWFSARMNMLCIMLTFSASVIAVCLKGELHHTLIALVVALTVQMGGLYQHVARLGCQIEASFTSVERFQSYILELDAEGPAVVEENRPPVDWPTRGRISMRDVMMRYRPGLPLALKGITFDIEPQEKIGIVGRTGAGKSSIGAVLFRLVDITSGVVCIDSVDIASMGLEDLRSRMSIIPQDPVLFKGTIRYNLDPIKQYNDMELWEVLEKTHIKDKIMCLDGGLDAVISEGGGNFSVGEKQLLCIARTLLKRSRVVLLDEATASVDMELDNLLQDTIQEVFNDCTVLIIAHRKSTVMKCDRIMVLSDGKVVEFDKPSLLLSNPNSHFSLLMTDDDDLVTEL